MIISHIITEIVYMFLLLRAPICIFFYLMTGRHTLIACDTRKAHLHFKSCKEAPHPEKVTLLIRHMLPQLQVEERNLMDLHKSVYSLRLSWRHIQRRGPNLFHKWHLGRGIQIREQYICFTLDFARRANVVARFVSDSPLGLCHCTHASG